MFYWSYIQCLHRKYQAVSLHPRGEGTLQTRTWSVVCLIFLEVRTVGSGSKVPPACSRDIENSPENGVCVKILPLWSVQQTLARGLDGGRGSGVCLTFGDAYHSSIVFISGD